MNAERDEDTLPQRESQLIESLLRHALSDDQEKLEQQIQRLNASIRSDQVELADPRRGLLKRPWFSLSAAAAILIASLTAMSLFRNEALAAVERSLRAEKLPIDRQYEVTITTQDDPNQRRTVTVELYVRQNRVVVHASPEHQLGEAWIYIDGDSRWIVPVSGSPLGVPLETSRGPLIGSPPLVISTILQRLRDGHDLELLPAAILDGLRPGDPPVVCDHVIGNIRSSASGLFPRRVEFWSDQAKGVVFRLTAEFDESEEAGVLTLNARLTGTRDLPVNFFDHKAYNSVHVSQ